MSDSTTKVPSYQDTDAAILPLPAFLTVETPDQVERPADDQAGRINRTFEDWERETMANMNRMATDDTFRRELVMRQS